MIIRDARPADIAMVRRLIGQLADAPDEAEFHASFERVSAESGHRLIVAELESEVVGVLHVGEALMREAEAWAVARKLASTALYTRIDRDGARLFYERIGYRLKATSHLMAEPSLGRGTAVRHALLRIPRLPRLAARHPVERAGSKEKADEG
jgi:hypothetical protein